MEDGDGKLNSLHHYRKRVGVSQMPSENVDLSPWLPLFWMHKHLCSQRNGRWGVALSRSLPVLDVSR